jgi:hypothetical protein
METNYFGPLALSRLQSWRRTAAGPSSICSQRSVGLRLPKLEPTAPPRPRHGP